MLKRYVVIFNKIKKKKIGFRLLIVVVDSKIADGQGA